MPQEMDNYILGVVRGRDTNVVSCSGFDVLCYEMLSHVLALN